jgi:hypothetical protein
VIVILLLYDRTIYITGEIGVDVTLLDVIKQVKQQSAAESFFS